MSVHDHLDEWEHYTAANARAHADYMRYRANRDLPLPDEIVPHGPNSDPHYCKRPECREQNRAKQRAWREKRAA